MHQTNQQHNTHRSAKNAGSCRWCDLKHARTQRTASQQPDPSNRLPPRFCALTCGLKESTSGAINRAIVSYRFRHIANTVSEYRDHLVVTHQCLGVALDLQSDVHGGAVVEHLVVSLRLPVHRDRCLWPEFVCRRVCGQDDICLCRNS